VHSHKDTTLVGPCALESMRH